MEVYHLQLRVVHGSFKAKIEITISSSEVFAKRVLRNWLIIFDMKNPG